MGNDVHQKLTADVAEALTNTGVQDSLYTCMKRGRDGRRDALAERPGGAAFRAEVKAAKERCIACQDELLERFKANAEHRGAVVHLAKDAADAIRISLEIAQERNAKLIAKSKSLTTEELELNHPLQEAGLQVIETDLGELIIQLVNDKPYHLVFPSVHKTAKDVAKIFSDAMNEEVSSDIDEIMVAVRKYLRPIFLNTDIGMTGANIGIAETGGIVIETNEGNGRLVSTIGDCHVCVMGVEKIVDTIEDALLMVMAHPVSAIGQCPTTYVTWLNGRSPMGTEPDGPRESHIIVLDNGRSAMRDDPKFRDALHCIRCGACMNVCPTYGVVGGHTFGHIYPGPMGIPWTAQTHGLEIAADFAPLCISCGLCKEICPADINLPMMIAEVKHRGHETHPPSRAEVTMMKADRMASMGSTFAPIANALLGQGWFRALLERFQGIDRRRTLPRFQRPSLEKRMAGRSARTQSKATRKVVLFPDVYLNYNAPDMGEALVRHLESRGCEVIVPRVKASGYPYVAYGEMDMAREVAVYNVRELLPYAEQGYTIVSAEPTAAYTLKKTYPVLLDQSADSLTVSESVSLLFDLLNDIDEGEAPQSLTGRRFGVHCSCHQRPMDMAEGTLAWLRRRGAECVFVETGTCCGMGGTFGMKAGALGFDLSNAVGQRLFDAFEEAGVEAIVTESSVCALHLTDGTGLDVLHPLSFLDGDG